MLRRKFVMLMGTAAVAAMSGSMLAGCSGGGDNGGSGDAAASGDASSQTDPSTLTTFIVGFDQSYPPYGFVGDDGEFTGFDLDLAAEVCSRNGWTLQLEAIEWDAKDTLLNSGAITCIWNGFTMEGREDGYTFSEPYMLNEQVVVVKADSGIASLDDLAGKTVITQVDSAAFDVLEGDKADLKATFANLETIGEYNTAFMQLESGAVEAVACDLSIAQYQMSAKPDVYTQLDEALSSEHYAVGFKQGDTELADTVTQTLKDMVADGTVEELCDKYAEYGLTYDNWILA
ncbi:MAG TPA: transporter substrate-binding domain-containing protein [Slackia equolifaciens]|uniref:Transporter substrate-binding domain-containing protein n=2 Tax=Slackia equolifaciens TaxID=498718 RepID=A0A9D2UVB0_9ACTN|nr:transporter substrate-binding domain-containing protein [Slackia equolifaciens]HJF64722.1 transporter substrate-binding domain-containing protein [Slackia equolifaciens]